MCLAQRYRVFTLLFANNAKKNITNEYKIPLKRAQTTPLTRNKTTILQILLFRIINI